MIQIFIAVFAWDEFFSVAALVFLIDSIVRFQIGGFKIPDLST